MVHFSTELASPRSLEVRFKVTFISCSGAGLIFQASILARHFLIMIPASFDNGKVVLNLLIRTKYTYLQL
jgi:hypothetical protein